jgi:enamidase
VEPAVAGSAGRLDALKVYGRATAPIMRAAIEAARRRGIPVTTHVGTLTAREAVELGVDGLEHGPFTFPEFIGGPDAADEYATLADLDVNGAEVESLLAAMVDHNVFVTATSAILAVVSGDDEFVAAEWLQYLSSGARALWGRRQEAAKQAPTEARDKLKCAFEKQLAFIGRAHERGVRIFVGTDPVVPLLVPGFALHIEIELLTRAGIGVESAIRSASLAPAELFGIHRDLGSVETGKLADILIVDGRVDTDVRQLLKPVCVIKGGALYSPAALRAPCVGAIQ